MLVRASLRYLTDAVYEVDLSRGTASLWREIPSETPFSSLYPNRGAIEGDPVWEGNPDSGLWRIEGTTLIYHGQRFRILPKEVKCQPS